MSVNKVELESKGIKRALKNYSAYDAIVEYIWNGFDADATHVDIQLIKNELDSISGLMVKDNGYGINKDTLPEKFKPIFESNKIIDRVANKNSSIIHGKNGVGRFTFFTFSDYAEWTTVYKFDKKNYKYTIEIDANELEKYIENDNTIVTEPTGTIVRFFNFNAKNFDEDDFYDYLILEFAWFLELNKNNNYSLTVLGKPLEYNHILQEKEHVLYKDEKTGASFEVDFCRWEKKLHEEYSKYYYINSNNREVYKENTTLNNKGDKFYHSVFIKSDIFNNFTFDKPEGQMVLSGYSKESDEFIFIKKKVDLHLRNMRNPYVKQYTQKYIDELKRKGVYPQLQKDNFMDKVREKSLDEMITVIYSAAPNIFSNLNTTQQKTLIRLFDLTMQSGEIDGLYSILEGILDMSCDDRSELSDLLKYTTMSNITKAISLIKDRLSTIDQLKQLVLDKSLLANEVDHLQPFIERNYWIFGEQYYLVTAEEPDFEEALRRFLYVLRGEDNPKGSITIDHKHKQKEMDIFAVQRKLDGEIKKSIVVELKHPNKTLGSNQLQQVKNYFSVITKDARFNAPNIEWEFFLVGNKINDEIKLEIESNQNHGERSLAFKAKNKKIYVKTWSEIFTDQEINLQFLQKELLLKQERIVKENHANTVDEIFKLQEASTAISPKEVSMSR